MKKLGLALTTIVAAACGSNDKPNNNDSADAGLSYDAATPQADAMATPPSSTIVAVSGDYSGNGVLTTISLPSMVVKINAVAGVVGGDPVVRVHGDRLVILDRYAGDSVTILDRNLQLVGQVSTGAGSNPQDSAIVGTKLYIAALDAPGVLVFDLANLSGGIQSTIDLSTLDSADNTPDCNSLIAVGTRLYVSCQVLDRSSFAPRGVGKIAVIDTGNNSLLTVLNLSATNPFALFTQTSNGDLLLSTAPGAIFGATNDAGCVERISTGPTPAVEACLTSNNTLNAYPKQVLPKGNDITFVNVESYAVANLKTLSNGTVSDTNLPNLGTNISGIAACPNGWTVVDDNSTDARGIRVYDGDDKAVNAAPIDVGWNTSFSPTNSTVCW